MPLIQIDALPPQTTRGTVVRLLEQVGEIARDKIGAIEIKGRAATVEVPAGWETRLVKALDGALVGTGHVRASVIWAGGVGRGEDPFARLARLLELESAEEARRAAQEARRGDESTGQTLVGLVVQDETAGLGGRALLTLAKKNGRSLPWTRLNVGSPVLLLEEDRDKHSGWRGIVCQRQPSCLQIALDSWPDPESERPVFRLALAHDEVARTRQRNALERARIASADRLAQFREVLLGNVPPRFRPAPRRVTSENAHITSGGDVGGGRDGEGGEGVGGGEVESMGGGGQVIHWLDANLNDSQQEAIRLALTAEDYAIIHGPPGTGKTTTVVELIRQAVRRGEKVLACAPSNLAVDNMLERLVRVGERAVRIGHPARVLPELREHTLDLLVDAHPDLQLARKLVREAHSLRDKAGKWTRGKPQPGSRQQMREEARDLIQDARRLEAQVVKHLLDSADIVCSTTTAIDSEILGQRAFDLAVIDEACQSTEPGCWIPLLRSRRVILAGDHCQLPPTVVSREAEREGFGLSMLERLIMLPHADCHRRLDIQYRMHEQIMRFSSDEFYDGGLTADASVRGHLLSMVPGVESNELTQAPLEFIDSAGASYDEELEPEGESRRNPQEAALVAKQVERLCESGLPSADIAVITPYAAQARLLREQFSSVWPDLEIDTVDGFQGREKEAVIVSLVRSNSDCEIGFLADTRRMNVALTRARRKLIVIGDSATIGSHEFYQRLLAHFEQSQAYRTVWEYMS